MAFRIWYPICFWTTKPFLKELVAGATLCANPTGRTGLSRFAPLRLLRYSLKCDSSRDVCIQTSPTQLQVNPMLIKHGPPGGGGWRVRGAGMPRRKFWLWICLRVGRPWPQCPRGEDSVEARQRWPKLTALQVIHVHPLLPKIQGGRSAALHLPVNCYWMLVSSSCSYCRPIWPINERCWFLSPLLTKPERQEQNHDWRSLTWRVPGLRDSWGSLWNSSFSLKSNKKNCWDK